MPAKGPDQIARGGFFAFGSLEHDIQKALVALERAREQRMQRRGGVEGDRCNDDDGRRADDERRRRSPLLTLLTRNPLLHLFSLELSPNDNNDRHAGP